MTAKIRAKAGLMIGLAACLSIGGALAMALSDDLRAIAQIETSQQTDSSQDPKPGDIQSPVEAAPEDPDTTPDTGDTQAPAQQEDTQQAPQPTETLPPGPGETQGPNTAPDVTPESSESGDSKARTENIVFVSTAEGSPTSEIEGESERFGQIVGSGRLLVNEDDQVTGYYFIVSGLSPSQTLPYHFHRSKNGSTPTSCEGDKEVLEDEAAGEILLPLNPIAPLQSTASGLAIVGSATSPIQLPNPVPFEDIGYLNIHATEDPTSGIVCANVPLKPVTYTSSGQPVAPAPSPESNQTPPTQGPNTAPQPPGQDTQGPNEDPEAGDIQSPNGDAPNTQDNQGPEPSPGSTDNPPTQGPNTAPVPPTMNN